MAILIALAAPALAQHSRRIKVETMPGAAPAQFGPSIATLQAMADGGDARATGALAYRYRVGFGVPRDPKRAFTLAQLAADRKDAFGLYNLAACYDDGTGVAEDKAKGQELIRQAFPALEEGVKNRNVWCAFAVACCYENGWGVDKDPAKAVVLYTRVAAAGFAPAQRKLAVLYVRGQGVPKDETKAAELCSRAAAQDHAAALTLLGQFFANGWGGIAKDDAQAVAIWQKAAALGDPKAMGYLGSAFIWGKGVEKDPERGAALVARAAENGLKVAVYELGECYYYGRGVPKDGAKALELYRKFHQATGNPAGLYVIGECYEKGVGVPQDINRAFEFFDQFELHEVHQREDADDGKYNFGKEYYRDLSDKLTDKYVEHGRTPPTLRRLAEKLTDSIEDPNPEAYGGPPKKVIADIVFGTYGAAALMAMQNVDGERHIPRTIRRGEPSISLLHLEIPTGTKVYPIRIQTAVAPIQAMGGVGLIEDFYFFKNEFGDWSAVRKSE